ncbi:MAG: hypothetical protein HOA57_03590 [Candidatus Magasanikbacteria bacterium]|jgi:hypothetical protein|nr:hypothetical protein [Candidatus Magasanikbacteria bacterium]MBT4314556.1 hypothetical protein [Candidatus Magasanikbacteria bacterium]MBT4547454.1 hypothetical protein [Candidatus Magasanikbacteria bacterium]MBT6819436.1 hypothetical protein [Candidatus Magasanikbacteria bacterium]
MAEKRETEGVPMLTKGEFDRITMGDVDNDDFQTFCSEKGVEISGDPKAVQEIVIDGGKIAKMVTYRGDFGTIINEDSIVARHSKFTPKVEKEVERGFSSEEFPAGATKKFVDLETSETKEGKVVSLKMAEGKKIVELEMDDGSMVDVSIANIIEE